MAAPAYSKEEVSALRGIFALYDPDGTGEIGSNDLENLLQKIGLGKEAAVELIKQFDVEEPNAGRRCRPRRGSGGKSLHRR